MPPAEIKAVLFDLGDTLVNFGKFSTTKLVLQGARSSYDYLKGLGQPLGSFPRYFLRYLVRLRIRYYLSEYRGRDFDSLALLQEAGHKDGLTCSRAEWEEVIWHWYEPLSRLGELEPNLEETLTALLDRGLKLGIVSNTFVNRSSLERHLEQLGIRDFFSLRLYSYEMGLRKPDLRIFRAAAEQIEEAPENILFVGDRVDKDIRPALTCGMRAALKEAYTNAGKEPPAEAWRISRIAELLDLIEQTHTTSLQTANV
jgi:putative hydrolase of the HAD superfamily